MNRENLRSFNVQVKDSVPMKDTVPTDTTKMDTTKTDTTNTTAIVLRNKKGVKTISENNAERKEHLRIYAIKAKVE